MKKKKHALRKLMIGFWLALLSIGLLNAATIYVGPGGSDSNSGLSPSSPFLTVQHAVEYVASHGGPENNNVILLDGSWSNVTINEVSACENWTSNLLIQGEHSNVQLNVTNYCKRLTFKGFKTKAMKMLRPADYCKLEDIVGVGKSWWEISASHITYLRCKATDPFDTGDLVRIAAEGNIPDRVPTNILLEDCCFRGADEGGHIDVIQTLGVSGLTLRNCKIYHAPTGLLIPTSTNGVPLEHITLENCWFGQGKVYTGQVDFTVTNCDFDGVVLYSTNNTCTWTGNRIAYLDQGVGDNPGDVFENNIIRTVGYEDGRKIQLPPNNTVDLNLTISEPVCAADNPDVQAPSVPNGLSAGLITGSSIALSWNASTDDYGVAGYKVYINGSNPVTVMGTSTTLTGLDPNTQYSLAVSAYDNAGNESPESSPLVVSTIALDTQAPSVPTGLSTGTVTSNSVVLSWNASTDNVGVTSYNVYVDGSNPVNVAGTSATINNLADNTQYSFTVSALDLEGNESAQSSSVNATTLELSGVVSSSSWQSFTESTQTGAFTVTFDAVPVSGSIDGVTGIQNGVAGAYGDLACIVRFNSSGQIDARNGGSYGADNTINYSAGVNYHFRVEIDIPSHTYDVYVTPQGSSEQAVASGFAFRTEQASVAQLTGWSVYAYSGSHTVDNMTFSTGAGDTQAPSVPSGLTTGTITSTSVALSWTASTDNIAVTGYKVYTDGSNPQTVAGTSTTITGLSADTQYSFTVSAIDGASNESAQSTPIMATTQSASTLTGYFVDPATGSMSNDGSEGSPWSTLEDVFAAGKTFQAGDVIYLKNGDHGWPDITQSNAGEVTIKSYPGDNPVINRIDFNGASNWTVEGVRVYNPAAPPEAPVLTHPVYGKYGNYLVRITESSYITLDNCYIYSIENSSEWTADDWNYKAWCGVFLYTNSHHNTIKNSLFENLNFPIDMAYTNSNTIQYNTIKNYCGDGLRVSTDCVIEYNEILDSYNTNGNHGDAMQAFNSDRAIIRGNKIFSTTSATRPFINYSLQGIGFFDGWFDDYVIENNLVVIHHWHGISLYGSRNSKIVNNTVVKNPLGSSSYGPPWIAIFNHKDGSASTGNVINNNLISDLESTIGSSTSNNIVTTSYTSHFTDYAGLDFSLQSTSSAVDGGTSSDAPSLDINQYLRSGTPDVGCYEYGSSTGGSSLTVTASADVTVGDAPLTVQFSGSATGGSGIGSFVESGGEIVMEAENYMRTLTNGDVTNWEVSTSLSGYAGLGYIRTPDAGVSNAVWGSACEVQYDIEVSASGTYNVWMLRNAPGNGSNSAFVGVDGTQHSNYDNVDNITGWYWASLGSISISSGSHTFSVQRREDGYNIDKIILTTSGSTPSGNTQSESSIAGHTYSWNFGDGSTSSEQNPSHMYISEGNYTAVLTVSDGTNNAQDDVSITVNDPYVPVSGLTVSPTSVTLSVGDTITLVAMVTPSNATDKSVVWTSSNELVATVDSNGLVTAITSGQSAITVATVDGGYIVVADILVSDTQAPSVPTGLAAGTVTETTVDLSWNASTDNIGVTGYKVYTDGSNPVTIIGTSTTISDLTSGTQYSFTVSAVDAADNESVQSSAVQVTTESVASDVTLNPVADAFVRGGTYENDNYGTDDELAIKSSDANYTREAYLKFDLSGVASPVDTATLRLYLNDANSMTHYLKLVSDDSWTEAGITYANAPSVGSTIASWSASTAGYIEVDITSTVASEVGGMLSLHIASSGYTGWSAYDSREGTHKPELIIKGSDTQAPSVPTGLAAGSVTETTVDLSWTASTDNVDVTGYKVYTDGSSPVSVTGTSTTISDLIAGTQYIFTVSAVDAVGNESAQSSSVQVTTDETSIGITVDETIQAEDYSAASGCSEDDLHSGYTGSGFLDFGGNGTWAEWNTTLSDEGTIDLSLRYANGSTDSRQCNLTVNSSSVGNVSFSPTGGWTTWNTITISIDVVEGINTIRLTANTSYGGPNLDKLDLDGEVGGGSGIDTQAPSVPTGLAAGTITSNSVALSWNASTDNVGVTGYKVYTDGSNPVTVTGTSTTMNGLAASTQYSFTVSAIDSAGNESAQSSSVSATTSAASGITSNSTWQSFGISTETGVFTATFDAVPNGNNIDALTGILNGSAGTYGDVACIIRFNTSGQIDARNGGSYEATNAINYTSGTSYHFRVEISVPTHTYAVYVTPQGGSEQTVASNFAFRSEQASVSQLTGWTLYALTGTHTVSNMVFTPAAPDTEAPSVPTNLISSNIYATGFTLSWTASTDNVGVTGYEVFKDGVSVGTTITTSMAVTGLVASTTYSMTVKARDAVPNWSASSSALNVTTSASGANDWPTSATTGPSGTLTSYSGDITASTNGQVIENMNISGRIFIEANNVTVRNCIFGALQSNSSSYTGAVIEDCILGWAGTQNFTLRRCEMSRQSGDLIRISGGNVVIEDCYLHIDGPSIEGTHADIIQSYPTPTFNCVIRHNTLHINMDQTGCVNADDVTIENNLIAGGSYSLYGNRSTIINNHFSTIFFSSGGRYGIYYPSNTPAEWSGNVWHETGEPIPYYHSALVKEEIALEEIGIEHQEIKLYPNPVTSGNILHIQLKEYDTDMANIHIIDVTGRLVYNQLHVVEQAEVKVSLNNLNKGIYIISVNGKNQKLIVE